MPCIINYPAEASVVIFVLWALQFYSPHHFEDLFLKLLFILSCLVMPKLEELNCAVAGEVGHLCVCGPCRHAG